MVDGHRHRSLGFRGKLPYPRPAYRYSHTHLSTQYHSQTSSLSIMILRCTTFRTILSKSSRRHLSTDTSTSLEEWITTITSARPTFHHDTLDAHRAGQLLRTLPTRQQERSINVQSGDILGCGHHMIYFQPETMLRDLGQDGSSPVGPFFSGRVKYI
jgi:hypothetical protein